ncbi:MAG: hypothetical protein OXI01_15265 [Albidovulum sp.]|nr:hypothetical protein [Albidovulum sp.]
MHRRLRVEPVEAGREPLSVAHPGWNVVADLATLTLNEVGLPVIPKHLPTIVLRPTKQQERSFSLLGIDPSKAVAMQLAGWRGEIRSIRSENAGVFLISIS